MRIQISPKKLFTNKLNLTPSKKQQEIFESVQKNKVTLVKATRRGGKSLTAGTCASALALTPSTRTTILAPTIRLTEIIFNTTADIITSKLNIEPTSLNYKDKVLKTDWGSEVRSASFKNMKQVLGVSNDLFIIDEAAVADTDNFEWLFQEIFPTLVETDGHLLAITTPRGYNYFFDLWEYAKTQPDWNTISYTIYDVDHIPREEVETLKAHYFNLGMEKLWEQEFMANFIAFTGQIYSFLPEPYTSEEPPQGDYFIGIDPGAAHLFAVVVVCINDKGVFIQDGYASTGATGDHAQIIQEFINKYDPLEIYIDHAAKQTAVDLAYEYDISCRNANKAVEEGINFMRGLKGRLFINQNSQIFDTFMTQWNLYKEKEGRIIKKNDDLLDALRYAVYTAYQDFYVGSSIFTT
jgi:hypothetical protein